MEQVKIKGYENYSINEKSEVYSHYNNIILKQTKHKGYMYVTLSENGIKRKYTVHSLMAITFLNHTINKQNIVVDHINENKSDNRLSNLQLVSMRCNVSKSALNRKKTSKYTGVYYHKPSNKQRSHIRVDKKRIYLGHFVDEELASKAYEDYIKKNKL